MERISIKDHIYELITLAKKHCWNDFPDSYSVIFSEISNDYKSFDEERKRRLRLNAKKTPLSIEDAEQELNRIIEYIYDINFLVYKVTPEKTIIEIRSYFKSSLDPEYRITVKNTPPMVHCKINTPPHNKELHSKFDINWEHNEINDTWFTKLMSRIFK